MKSKTFILKTFINNYKNNDYNQLSGIYRTQYFRFKQSLKVLNDLDYAFAYFVLNQLQEPSET